MKIECNSLILEIIRSCNMNCEHCLRGNPDPVQMTQMDVRRLFGQITRAGTVVVTGGEPTIHPNFSEILYEVADHADQCYSGYMATNGTGFTYRNWQAMQHWHDSVDEVNINVSNDQFHRRERNSCVPTPWEEELILTSESEGIDANCIYFADFGYVMEYLTNFGWVYLETINLPVERILDKGNALENGIGGRSIDEKTFENSAIVVINTTDKECWNVEEMSAYWASSGEEVDGDVCMADINIDSLDPGESCLWLPDIVVSANGNITFECDLSCEEADSEYKVGNAFEEPLGQILHGLIHKSLLEKVTI